MDTARRKRERGSAIVEAALVGTTLLGLIVLTFDVAVAIFLKATFEHAAREGARYAITYQTMPGLSHDASVKQTVVNASLGFLKPENVTVKYYNPSSPTPDVEVPPPGGNEPDNVVVVSVTGFSWAWMFPKGFFPGRNASALSITASSADRMEALGAGQVRPPR